MQWSVLAILGILLIYSIYTDFRTGKIYNHATFPAMLIGVTMGTIMFGVSGLVQSILGVALAFVLYMLFAPAAGIGGGDTKLLMAVGALIGFKLAIWSVLYSAVAGGVLALLVLAQRRVLVSTTGNMINNLYMKTLLRAPVDITTGSAKIKFRYSPAIALGTVIAILIHSDIF
ncbi:MAG: A24 family peptidase [Armatimonadota bacterium]